MVRGLLVKISFSGDVGVILILESRFTQVSGQKRILVFARYAKLGPEAD